MSRRLAPFTTLMALMGSTALADVPNVVTDIAPVHSLVARVMEGVGEPHLIIPSGASPHEYSLRPSEASALQDADIVVWIGEGLTPWMEGPIETLAEGATVVTLLEVAETVVLNFREGALFEAHDHDEDHDEDHDDDHEDHADEGHDDHDEDHDDHEDHAEDEHGHDDHDPHAWLSPTNASAWLNVIAAQLSATDPDNAGAYFANAAAARAEMEALSAEVDGILEPVRGGSFIVFHDAYQYFELDFGMEASGAISLGDAADPSPARIAEVQERLSDGNIGCVLSEPQYNAGLVATVLDGTDANTGIMDPLGVDLTPGAALYPQLIRNMAQTLADCL